MQMYRKCHATCLVGGDTLRGLGLRTGAQLYGDQELSLDWMYCRDEDLIHISLSSVIIAIMVSAAALFGCVCLAGYASTPFLPSPRLA